MLPAFADRRAAARFSALLLFLLLLPVILKFIGLPPRFELYNSMRAGEGPYVKTRQQLFDTSDDIDIAFVGSSVLNMAVDADDLQARMVERFGDDVSVRMFGFVFQGFDLQYVMIRDLLERRHVKMLVTSFSGPHVMLDRPHVQLHRMLRYGDYPDAFRGLSALDRAAIYGSYVLDGPRQFVNWLRYDEPVAQDDRRSLMIYPDHPQPPGAPAPAVVLSDETRDQFIFSDATLTRRQRYFVTAIAQLAKAHNVALVIVNVPMPEDRSDKIWERADWPRILAEPPTVVGFRRSELFPDSMPMARFFQDSTHLSAEGKDCMTRSLAPFLVDHYAELTNRH